jgi:hypothetical protein
MDTPMRDPKKKAVRYTDAERHKRFVETAKKVEASESIDDFDIAFSSLNLRNADATGRPPTHNVQDQNAKRDTE